MYKKRRTVNAKAHSGLKRMKPDSEISVQLPYPLSQLQSGGIPISVQVVHT